MITYPAPNTAGILWAAPFCLHDSSSGAAIQMRLIFKQLAKRGVRCHAVSAFTFDAPNGTATFPNLEEQLSKDDIEWFNLEDAGVTYQYLKTKSQSVQEMTRAEEGKLYGAFLDALESFKPDVLLIYGGGVLEMSIVAEAKRRGIATVIHIPNGNYANYNFPNVDMLLSDSAASARNYYNNSRINIMPMGTFIDAEQVLVKKAISPEYITFINPQTTKGISLVLSMAAWAKKKHPDWRFLVVESRGTWRDALSIYKQKAENFQNVDVAQHTTDIKLVYERTKLLLVPSLCYEGFGRVAAEAVINGIPVLASKSGGLVDAVNGGGMCIDAPQKCHADFNYYPSNKEMKAWFEALENMLDLEEYPKWQEKAREAGSLHSIEKSTDTLMGYLKPWLERRASFHSQYFLR